MDAVDVKHKIEAGLPGSRADVTGTDAHFSATVTAEAFAGKTMIQQHQLVYATLRDEMASQQVHALALKTRVPAESPAESKETP